MLFYERLNLLMKKNNITGKQLTTDLGIARNSITYWKKNGNLPKKEVINKLTNYFNCSEEYLLGFEDNKKQTAELQSDNEGINKLIEIGTKLSPEHLQALLVLAEELEKGQSE